MEGAEDSEVTGMIDLAELSPPLNGDDVVVGIASSGRTPYVLGGLKHARSVDAVTIGLACVQPSLMRGLCDTLIECVTGPEVVTGSTRLKAGTATKMVSFTAFHLNHGKLTGFAKILNMISTGSQIRIGKTFGNLVSPLNLTPARAFHHNRGSCMLDGGFEDVKREASRQGTTGN